MLISTYTHRKQALLEAQGVTTKLVPDDQIDDTVEQLPLSTDCDAEACPYCRVFYSKDCDGCPMYKADNECMYDDDNTYDKVRAELKGAELFGMPGLQELITQYNNELKD